MSWRCSKKKKKSHRVVFNMDSECFFYFWVYKNGQRHSFVTVVLFMLNMNIVSCWNPENDVAKKEKEKKRAIISSYRYVYFHVLYWFLRNGLCLLHFLLLYLCSMQPFVSHREIHKDLFLNLCSLSFIWQVSNLQSTEGWTWNWWDIIN